MKKNLCRTILLAALAASFVTLGIAAEEDVSKSTETTTETRDRAWLKRLKSLVSRIELVDKQLSQGKSLSRARKIQLKRNRKRSLAGLKSAAAANIDNYTAQIFLARAFLHVGEYDRALDAAERAVQLGPKEVDALSVRALILFKKGNHPRAHEDAKKVLMAEPENKGALEIYERTMDDFNESSEEEK